MNCCLCKSKEVRKLEAVDKKLLSLLYYKLTKTDFSYLLNREMTYCECNVCKLKFFHPLISGDEKFYNSLQKFDWYYPSEKEEYMIAKKYIKQSDRVLEVGSGKGAFAKKLKLKNYIGLDFSLNAKTIAEKNGITIENKTIEEFASENLNMFDVVASFQVLEHVTKPNDFIESKLKSLSRGGYMIIAVPSENSFYKYMVNGILNMPPHHLTRWSDDTLGYIAKKYNLELINIYHEKVQPVHKKLYFQTLIESSILKIKLLDNPIKRKVFAKFSGFLYSLFGKKLKDEMLPNGHTVVAVYKKK